MADGAGVGGVFGCRDSLVACSPDKGAKYNILHMLMAQRQRERQRQQQQQQVGVKSF